MKLRNRRSFFVASIFNHAHMPRSHIQWPELSLGVRRGIFPCLSKDQLHIKDEQMEKLKENIHKQEVHIQSLIQEDRRLNIKLLSENTENKKTVVEVLVK